MNQEEMSEIIDGVYFQKLSAMLGNLQSWQKRKEEIFYGKYGQLIEGKLMKLDRNENEVKNQLLEFIKMLNIQYSFLSKLKKEDKQAQISAAFPKFQAFAESFSQIKSAFLQLSQFLGKFIGVTNYEYTEIKKVYQQARQMSVRYENQKSKFLQLYNQKKQLMYSKKYFKKHFQLSKYLELVELIVKQRKLHAQTFLTAHGLVIKEMDIRIRMYKDIKDNLEHSNKLHQRAFKQDMLGEIMQYFSEKYEKVLQEREKSKEAQNAEFDEDEVKQIRQEFYKYYDSFIEGISVGNWGVTFKKKEEGAIKQENQQKANMIVTFDNKILLFNAVSRQFYLQQIIEEVKVYPASQTEKLFLKDKKTKLKFQITFDRVEKQDEFNLHLQKMNMQI